MSTLTHVSTVPSDRHWLPGLPHALLGAATCLPFGFQGCVTGLLLATLASFIVYLPLTALALNKGRPIGEAAPAPALPRRAQWMLLALWTVTAWGGAALAATRLAG